MAEKDLFAAFDIAPPDVGENTTIARLRAEAADCRRCDLYKYATQTVFGEGPEDAKIVMVGEVPGDQEDLQGKPFVGPAGKLLDRAMQEAGIDRSTVYVTNAVKHFKFSGAAERIHKTPGGRRRGVQVVARPRARRAEAGLRCPRRRPGARFLAGR